MKYEPMHWALTSAAIMELEGNYLAIPNKMEAAVCRALLSAADLFQKYDKLVLVFPKQVSYSPELIQCILRYWQLYHNNGIIIENAVTEIPTPGTAYFTLDDKDLTALIAMGNMLGYEAGRELGFLSLGDSPVKKLLALTVLTIIPVDLTVSDASLFEYLQVLPATIKAEVIRRGSL